MSEVKQPHPRSPSVRPARHSPSRKPTKPRKPAPITPRRFTKFFTPVAATRPQRGVRTSRRALQRITNPPAHRKDLPGARRFEGHGGDQGGFIKSTSGVRRSKRKLSLVSSEISARSSPLRREPFFLSSSQENHDSMTSGRKQSPETNLQYASEDDEQSDELNEEDADLTRRDSHSAVRRFYRNSQGSNILASRLSGLRRKHQPKSSVRRPCETASFYSGADDAYFCGTQAHGHPVLPFCSASCNTNSLVAIGDEEGGIRLLESASNSQPGFSQAYLMFKPHDNAVMDLDFSEDDLYLATGAGDQTCRIIDMVTQQTLHTLSGHCSSIKRVQFQPESNNSLLASCSRDGTVNMWDLRDRNRDRASQQLCCGSDDVSEPPRPRSKMANAVLKDSIHAAHADVVRNLSPASQRAKSILRGEEASVTSLVFLGSGRQHLLATSSESNASVRLWDMRMTYDARRTRPQPVSMTRQPESHELHRQFGVTSMAVSTDSGRLFTLCRDHTVYAYSTSHLILGHAPELGVDSVRPRRARGAERPGLGPLYGFRHRQLEASTFYIKLAVRRRKGDQSELLAAGSGNDCAVIFPTNERNLPSPSFSPPWFTPRPAFRQEWNSPFDEFPTTEVDLPIYQHGTALIRGHRKEVTACAWTSEGQLVTIGDDFHARCWREGGEARALRTAGEGEGRRWMSGWAELDGTDYDDEDDGDEG